MPKTIRLRAFARLALCPLAFTAAACSGGSSGAGPAPTVTVLDLDVDAGAVAGALAPIWGDHYDLSYAHMDYSAEPGFVTVFDELQPRTLRCSVGRWEIGFPPPAGGDSTDPDELKTVEREFYRGANDMVAADDPANYDFTYLDSLLTQLADRGVTPFLCFDYMPFTLSAEQDPLNADNFNLSAPGTPFSMYSFSNGIRTAPPADPAVYARVVRNTVLHTRGLFAGTTDFGVTHVEIGNEPDLIDAFQAPMPFFWTGDRVQWIEMYEAVAAELDADPVLSGTAQVGGGSFAFPLFEMQPWFLEDVLASVAAKGTRLDFFSFHSYDDDPANHALTLVRVNLLTSLLGISPVLVNGEWGRALDGPESVYDEIEHGIFRVQTLILMQAFGVRFAHEALLRDPFPGSNQLGLLKTGPAAHKPAAHCYRALNLLPATPEALTITAPAGTYAMAGRDSAGTKVVLVLVAERPTATDRIRAELNLANLPFGVAGYRLDRWKVDATTTSTGQGLELEETSVETGSLLETDYEWGLGEEGIVVWELTGL